MTMEYDELDEQELERRRRIRQRRLAKKRQKRIRQLKRRLLFGAIVIVALIISIVVAIASKVKSSKNNKKELPVDTSPNVEEVVDESQGEKTIGGMDVAGELVQYLEKLRESEEKRAEEERKNRYPTVSKTLKNIGDEDIMSPYIALLDVTSNEIIAGREATKKIYPASMTKVMTLLVVADYYEALKNEKYVFPKEMLNRLYLEEASVAGFLDDEEVGLDDLMYGLILPSGADCAEALAIMVAGNQDDFANLMNGKCKDLGLVNTHFCNSSGLHDVNQYTTPLEMAKILEVAMRNEICAKVLSTYQYTTAKTSKHPEGILLSSTMFSRMYGTEVEGVVITAGKTGYVVEAGNCLVNYAVKNGKAYIACMAGATYRWHSIFDSFYIYGRYLP